MNKLFILTIFLMSCVSLATNGSPITTPKDEVSIGIGASGVIIPGGSPIPVAAASIRYGLTENTDIGFSGFPIFGVFNTDVKFRNSNFSALIFGTGFSYFPTGDNWEFVLVPNFGLSFGNEKSYLSPRFIYPIAPSITNPLPVIQISYGLTVGKSIKFNPEMGFGIPLNPSNGQNFAFYFNYSVFYMPEKK